MTRNDTAILALRIAALYAWFQAVEYVATGVITYFFAQSKVFGGTSPLALFVYVLPSVAMALVGVLLWFRAPALARHFIDAETTPPTAQGSSSVVPLTFAVVGLAVFLHALSPMVRECVNLLRSEHFSGRDASQEFLQHLPSLAATAIQLFAGFILFVKPHRLARWWERKRDTNISV